MIPAWISSETIARIEAVTGSSLSTLEAELASQKAVSPIDQCKWLRNERGLSYEDAKTLVAIACDRTKRAEK